MKYNKLSNITYGELKNFTYEELSMDVIDLLKKLKDQNRAIPIQLYDKLSNLCVELETNVELSVQEKRILNNKDNNIFSSINKLNLILSFAKNLSWLVPKATEIIKELIKYFK